MIVDVDTWGINPTIFKLKLRPFELSSFMMTHKNINLDIL